MASVTPTFSRFAQRRKKPRGLRVTPVAVIACVALGVSVGGVAYSAIPGPDGKIYACYVDDADPDLSYVYLRDHDQPCQAGEEAISWTQSGGADQSGLDAAAAASSQVTSALDGTVNQIAASLERQLDRTDKKLDGALTPKDLKAFTGKQRKSLKEVGKAQDQALAAKRTAEELFAQLTVLMKQQQSVQQQIIQSLRD